MSTSDPDFVSPAGHRVGDIVRVEQVDITAEPGFEIHVGRNYGGWIASVGFGNQVTVSTPDGTDKQVALEDLPATGPIGLRVEYFSTRDRW